MKKLYSIFFMLYIASSLFSSTLHFGPYLQSPKPDGITILWETTEAVIGTVVFGETDSNLNQRLSEQKERQLHIIKLTGLKPSHKYFYVCRWGEESTEVFHFKTAPDKIETPIRIGIIADSRSQPEIFARVCDQLGKYQPDIILHSGDLVAAGDQIEQWKPQFFEPAKNLAPITPIYPTLGNHERKAGYYYEHFTVHEGKPWWSTNYGSVYLLGLNTSEDGNPNSEQYNWMLQELEKNKEANWKIAIFHYPLFHVHPTRPVYDFRYYWTPQFIKHNINFVITGHDHYYCRTFPIGNMSEKQQGAIHITSAGGGAPLYPVIPQPFAAYYRSLYHFVLLEVTKEEILGKAVSIDGEVFDTFSIHKDQDFMPENFIEYEMFELERQLRFSLGSVQPVAEKNNEFAYEANIVAKTNFAKPIIGYYEWQTNDNWNFALPIKEKINLLPGESFTIPFKANSSVEQVLPTPILKVHLEADNSIRNVSKSRPYQHFVGFKNQDFSLSLEEAIFSRVSAATEKDLDKVFSYLKYFSASKNADAAVEQLGNIFSSASHKADLTYLNNFLLQHDTPENKYRFYPFYLAARDYSHLDEWLRLADNFAPYKIDLSSQLISRLVRRKEMNTHTVGHWWVLSPFANENNAGLEIRLAPEEKVNLTDTYLGFGQQAIKWEEKQANNFGYLDLLGDLSANERFIGYAYTTVEANQAGKVLLLFGSNDGAALWVNGKEYFRLKEGRAARACDDIIPVPVNKGRNEILVKVAQEGGDWGLYLQIMDSGNILNPN